MMVTWMEGRIDILDEDYWNMNNIVKGVVEDVKP